MDQARGVDDSRRGMLMSLATHGRNIVLTVSQRALANQPWKEYTAEGGKKYWYNTETKQSSWEMPEIYKQALGVGTTTPTSAA